VSAFQDVALRELADQTPLAVPDIHAAGVGLRPQLPVEAFLASPADWSLESGLRDSSALRRAVRMNASRKVDWIKMFVTEGVGGDPNKMQFAQADIVAAVKEAGASKIPVLAHAFGDQGARIAVEAGVRSIEHGGLISEATLDLMKRRGVFFVPTAEVHLNGANRQLPAGVDDAVVRRNLMVVVPRLREAVQHARKKGVMIAAGTDFGYAAVAGRGVSYEIVSLVELGLTPMEALQSATIVGAELLGLDGSVGVLEAGYEADLIAVRGNPLEDAATLHEPLLVLSNGRIAFQKASQDVR
jgi:imidazolonepropionase-like amidohydrolase